MSDYRWLLPPVAPALLGRLGRCGRNLDSGEDESMPARPKLVAQVRMMCRPAGRFLTIPFPPLPFAARIFAAFILPPRLFFAMIEIKFSGYFDLTLTAVHLQRICRFRRFWVVGTRVAPANYSELGFERMADPFPTPIPYPESLRRSMAVASRRRTSEGLGTRRISVPSTPVRG